MRPASIHEVAAIPGARDPSSRNSGPSASPKKALPPRPTRIAVKTKGKIVFVDLNDVVAVRAEGNYALLQCDAGSFLLRESISSLAEKLEPYGFIRIHRSTIVNASLVEEIRPWLTGEYGLRMVGGYEFTVTRTYKKNLESLAELWIGADPFTAR